MFGSSSECHVAWGLTDEFSLAVSCCGGEVVGCWFGSSCQLRDRSAYGRAQPDSYAGDDESLWFVARVCSFAHGT